LSKSKEIIWRIICWTISALCFSHASWKPVNFKEYPSGWFYAFLGITSPRYPTTCNRVL